MPYLTETENQNRNLELARLSALVVELREELVLATQFVAKYANDHDSKIALRMVDRMEAAVAKAGRE